MDDAVNPDVLRVARMIVASGIPATSPAVPVRKKPYTVREAASAIGISVATMYREVARGHCTANRICGGRGAIRIPVADFEDYRRKTQAAAVTTPAAVEQVA